MLTDMTKISSAATLPTMLIVGAILAGAAEAAPLPASAEIVSYSIVDQDLRDVLTEIVQQAGLPSHVSDAVHGRVRGRLPSASLAATLNRLGRTYGFDWYFDASAVWISATSETKEQMIPLQSIDLSHLEQTLDALGISDPRWPLRASTDGKLVVFDGPVRYVDLVAQTIASLQPEQNAPTRVSVFRGSVSAP